MHLLEDVELSVDEAFLLFLPHLDLIFGAGKEDAQNGVWWLSHWVVNYYHDLRSILVVINWALNHCCILTFVTAHLESIALIVNMDAGVIAKRLVRKIAVVQLTWLEWLYKVRPIVNVYIFCCSTWNGIMMLKDSKPIFTLSKVV